ncbi:MAG: A/G-specific adenine glycosylase [Arenimonas sp.]
MFAETLLSWFDKNGRHDLPWQHPRAPYRVWLSEIMLQQTQVATVIPYFDNFLRRFPDLNSLAQAQSDDVVTLWAGLGYYTRARNLHRTAKICLEIHDGKLPATLDELVALPGIGRSTAAAILSQAHDLPFAILDGNVKRTLSRYYGISGWPGLPAVEKELWALSEKLLPEKSNADYTQAIMDFGATLCTRSKPRCMECPFNKSCIAFLENRVAELPQKKPGKKIPTRHTVMLVLLNNKNEVLLSRRPAKGVWSGMWSLPEVTDINEAETLLIQQSKNADSGHIALPEFQHTFSHYHLMIKPFLWRGLQAKHRIAGQDDTRWLGLTALASVGLPAPVKKLLESLSTQDQTL